MGKRRPASRTSIILRPSRAAKRAHTTAAHGGSRSIDWADLGDGPASLVAERVLADDVVGYVRFRAVCRSWMRCCDDPRTSQVLEDPRLRLRRWIMLFGEEEKLTADAAPHCCCRRGFLNVSTCQCVQVDVPELRDHGVLRSPAAEGLLFLHSKATGGVRLLNPLTRQAADLPPVTGLRKFFPGYLGDCTDSTAGLADDRMLWLQFPGAMAFAKPGDDRWVLLENVTDLLVPNVFFAGRIYGVSSHAIMTVDMSGGDDLPPWLVVVAELHRSLAGMQRSKTLHLVDNGGKLMLVHRTFRPDSGAGGHNRTYKVYRVDLEAGKVTTSGRVGLSLGGRTVFIGLRCALSVSPRVFPSIDANAVYPGLVFCERGGYQQIGAYRIRDRSTESFGYDSGEALPHPWSIADCLAVYVSG